jgi:hypothetical protein
MFQTTYYGLSEILGNLGLFALRYYSESTLQFTDQRMQKNYGIAVAAKPDHLDCVRIISAYCKSNMNFLTINISRYAAIPRYWVKTRLSEDPAALRQ